MSAAQEKVWTVGELLSWSRGYFEKNEIDSPRLTAELLLAHVLKVQRIRLYTDLDRPLVKEELSNYRELVLRRVRGEPTQYLLGTQEFYGRSFISDPRALIPRPETELVVAKVLENLPPDKPALVVDVGCGSGAIGLTIAAERPLAQVVLLDLSREALSLAQENSLRLGVETRVFLAIGDLLSPLELQELKEFSAQLRAAWARQEQASSGPEESSESGDSLKSGDSSRSGESSGSGDSSRSGESSEAEASSESEDSSEAESSSGAERSSEDATFSEGESPSGAAISSAAERASAAESSTGARGVSDPEASPKAEDASGGDGFPEAEGGGDEGFLADVIVANLPYVPDGELSQLAPHIREHEPHLALLGGADGLDLIRRLIPDAAKVLLPGGLLVMEHAEDQGPAIVALLEKEGWDSAFTEKDLAGLERFTWAIRR